MRIGNKPKTPEEMKIGKIYWQVDTNIKDVYAGRFVDFGWRIFEFCVFRGYQYEIGEDAKYIINIKFAYWLPFNRV